jgi:hypothetical protein
MIETIGRPRTRVVESCAAFAGGALAGGLATFGLAAAAGHAVRALGVDLLVAAPVVAVAAALAEARGAAIAPQIRRQVPEHWRRTLPLPLAAGLYGVLLGLGFTTFVLTYAVAALAAVIFALGQPALGVVVGIAFGVGRALPIVAVAPLAHRRLGVRIGAAMAERPSFLRAIRLADAAALLAVGAAIVVTDAQGATRLGAGTDPSVSGDAVVWTTPTGGIVIHEGQEVTASVPAHAVLGGSLIAWRDGDVVHVAHAADLTPVVDVTVPGVDAVAISDSWLVTRAPSATGDKLEARPLAAPDEATTVASVRSPQQLGRPALDQGTVVYHVATRAGSRIVQRDLAGGGSQILRRSSAALLTNPSLLAGRLLYVRQTSLAQLLELGPARPGARDRILYRLAAPAPHDAGHEPGHSRKTRTPLPRTSPWALWTCALSATHAYVTLLPRRSGAQPLIVSMPR